ncbi:MAG: hypothetical protein ABI120_06390, partial [Gemmatimonadaceae bacterium]
LLVFRGQTDAGLRQFLIARSTEPASALVRSWVSYAYYLQGQMDSALVESKRAFQSDSTNLTTLTLGALVLLKAHNVPGALEYVRRMNRVNHAGFFVLGRTDSASARARLHEIEQRQRAAPWLIEGSRAFAMLGEGDTAQAITSFERATAVHDVWPSEYAIEDPIFDSIRTNPRFQRLLHRVGLR